MLITIWGVILPSLVNPFGLYLMRVFWEASVPTELIEAARLDGAGEVRIFWGIGSGSKPVYNLIALVLFLSVVPLLAAFVLLGRYWRRGLTTGATTGWCAGPN